VPISLIVLIAFIVLAVIVGGAALIGQAQRRAVLARAGVNDSGGTESTIVLRPVTKEKESRGLRQWLLETFPGPTSEDAQAQTKLVQAGFDTPTAPATYFFFRVASFVAIPVLGIAFAPRPSFFIYAFSIGASFFAGWIVPMGVLDRLIRQRQERIRRSVPDALDLMVVCVEAGVSLDAAILRVSREIRLAHTDLAHELAVVNRKTNAGIPREIALRALWQRTGVEELRTLVSSMIQSEKWGTSIATVLRVSAETLRRKRRQTAEKKAKQAPLKMTFPLVLFILPALFTVIMGPALVQVITEFGKIGQ
jgi:tight adherence protein C